MDPVFDAQFREMRAGMLARDVSIDVAYKPNGDVDYVYATDQLIALDRNGNLDRISSVLRGRVERFDPEETRTEGGVAELRLSGFSVPEALRLIAADDRARLGRAERISSDRDLTRVSANGLVHLCRICNAVEPEVPPYGPTTPWPPLRSGKGGAGKLIGVCDTGRLRDLAGYSWLADVTGDVDELPPPDADGTPLIGQYDGHGTFIAGVARSVAPGADVVVTDHLTESGGELESVFCRKLTDLLRGERVPDVLNLSAGTYTWDDLPSVAFEAFYDDVLSTFPDTVLVAAAGNDGIDRPLWPAAFDWAIGVGALGPDETHQAWFTNYGDWVDVFVLGEGMVNAFPTGRYTYLEPPKRPHAQDFTGMARWDGTSFAAPLVAGLIAERMERAGEGGPAAVAALRAAVQPAVDAGTIPLLDSGTVL